MSAGAEQLTLDGRAVPHEDVVAGGSIARSRMSRRPASIASNGVGTFDALAWFEQFEKTLDAAGVRPGEAFYVTRVPPVDRPREGGARRSDPSTSKRAAAMVAPRTGSQRWALLVEFSVCSTRSPHLGGLTAEQAATNIGKPGAWRRVSELLAGGFIEPTGRERKTRSGADAEVYRITDKGRATLAAGRSTT